MTQPPRSVESLLEGFGRPSRFREGVLGDLAEQYALRAAAVDERSARAWYCREALRSAPHLLMDGVRSLGPHRMALLGAVLLGATVAFMCVVGWFVPIALFARAMGACCPVSTHIPGALWLTVLLAGIALPFAVAAYFLSAISRGAFVVPTLLLIIVSPAVIELLLYVDNSTANLETRVILTLAAAAGSLLGALHYARTATPAKITEGA